MEKLELKHLAPYLPYQLECYGASEIWHLEGLSHRKIWIKNSRGFQTMDYGDFEADYSILLHPLSDLTKQIDCPEVMGEKFVPAERLFELYGGGYESYKAFNNSFILNLFINGIKGLSYEIGELFISWRFDVFDLHSKNLCIYYDELNILK